MSSTSSSWVTAPPQEQRATSARLTIWRPQSSQYQTGIRCPHQSCREIHQSRMFSIQLAYSSPRRSGMKRSRPSRYAASAGSASGFIWTNHWSDSRGSITVSQR